MSLTGGTGDVNPQWFKMYQGPGAQDKTASTKMAIPVQRLQSRSKALVMEILRVRYLVRSGEGESSHNHVGLSTISPPTASKPDNSMGYIISALHVAPTEAIKQGAMEEDMTDGAGHGTLVATDFLYPFVCSTAASPQGTWDIWVLYRWKAVDLQEYSGMLQSQSN